MTFRLIERFSILYFKGKLDSFELNPKPPCFFLSKHVIRFHELPAETVELA